MIRQNPHPPNTQPNAWVRRLAWGLLGLATMLVVTGSIVTSLEAGMVIDDWPTTRGYWLYPISQWFNQGSDLALSLLHRTLGPLAAVVGVALAVALWKHPHDRPLRLLGTAALAGIVLVGLLGGLRVVFDTLLLRRLHSLTAPLSFALCAAVLTVTSSKWQRTTAKNEQPVARRTRCMVLFYVPAFLLLIVLGTWLRHPDLLADGFAIRLPGWLRSIGGAWIWSWFQFWVALKLLAMVLVGGVLSWGLVDVWRDVVRQPVLRRRIKLLGALVALQAALGVGVWVTNYNWPDWFSRNVWDFGYTVVHRGRWQVGMEMMHCIVGSLILAATVDLTLWMFRIRPARAGN